MTYLLIMVFGNEVPVDAGDGISHFSIAELAWSEPVYLLDHWGKPLFTFFSGIFAPFGFHAYLFFNVLVFAATCLVAFRLFKQWNVAGFYYFLFPLLLISIPDYVYCVLGGMTEPFFGLIALLVVYLAATGHWMWCALLCSFLPFARSEGMLGVALALPLLLLVKQWRVIPLLATGFVLYAIAGWLLIDDPWWYFTKNPYASESAYGHGTWNHYLLMWDHHFGLITLVLLPFGIPGCLAMLNRLKQSNLKWIILFAAALYGGIFFAHSIFWAYGLQASAGLTRLATLGLPPVLLFILAGCHFISKELNKIPLLLAGAGLVLLLAKELHELPYPLRANTFERILLQSAEYARKNANGKKVYYFHPLIAWKLGANMNKKAGWLEQRYFYNDTARVNALPKGGLLIRDPKFGPVEQGLSMETIGFSSKKLSAEKILTTDEPYSVYTGEPAQIIIYRIK